MMGDYLGDGLTAEDLRTIGDNLDAMWPDDDFRLWKNAVGNLAVRRMTGDRDYLGYVDLVTGEVHSLTEATDTWPEEHFAEQTPYGVPQEVSDIILRGLTRTMSDPEPDDEPF